MRVQVPPRPMRCRQSLATTEVNTHSCDGVIASGVLKPASSGLAVVSMVWRCGGVFPA